MTGPHLYSPIWGRTLERYVATNRGKEPIVRTNDFAAAVRYAALMHGQVIDMEEKT